MPVTEALAQALAARRSYYNGMFRRNGRGLSAQAMLRFLERTADPVVAEVAESARQQALDGLFELAVAALRRGLLGMEDAPSPFERQLGAALIALAAHLGPQSKLVIAGLGNGYLRLARDLGEERAVRWLMAMAELGDLAPGIDILEIGLVHAWQQGMAEARQAALERASSMGPELRERLFGAAVIDTSDERRFTHPASTAPLGDLVLWTRVGGFAGIGGPFSTPPELYRIGERIYATDGERVRELLADIYGGRLIPAGHTALEIIEQGAQDGASASANGSVSWGSHALRLDALRSPSSCVASASMVAVTLRDSHYIFVLGRPAQDHG